MIVGILQIELMIEGSQSLKDKRRVVSSLKDRLHREHQVSVAEVGQQDNHRTAMLGIAMAGSDLGYCQSAMDKLVDKIKHGRGYVLMDHDLQILTGQ